MEPLEADDPRQVGRFEIIARLGAGGMGRVYLARSESGEQFALKMIHQFLSDDVQFRRRFEREVMAAQRVTGENTAALVDADPEARPPWMAVEYVDGPTLSEMVERGGPLTLASCARLASGMAQALISIHAAGLVHRDLKPSNVLMGEAGARLIDFGIAQASGASSLTMTGLVTGSAGFMSPEQAQAERVTEASDVFALGTVLYFAATGRRPFGEGSMISVTYRVVHADPNLAAIRDDGLRELIADCLMKDPQRRPTPQEIYQRCPGIADGTWSVGRTGETLSTLAVGSTLQTGAMMQPPPVPISLQPPVTMPSRAQARRDGRGAGRRGPEGLRAYLVRPWLVMPVAVVLLATGAALAATLTGGTKAPPGSSFPEVTVDQNDVDGTTPPLELPGGKGDRPIIVESPTRRARPTTSATSRSTPRPTKTKPGTGGSPSPTVSDPDADPTTSATSEDPSDPTASPTPPEPTATPEPTGSDPANPGQLAELTVTLG